ncbi:hypothetical protein PN462_18900 [Spirulina sp. CS-785/01]|uniref:hypothetical protein n=1 Tax=Spirulina sp. CS-785/01 TaxID=3021716 RepID=UPI00232B090A|nr:hypothetical protein [Spirulina sp. CS-785/01]MDB9315190.1 hypothetical protein [Spirulina sp. CS-785/01]
MSHNQYSQSLPAPCIIDTGILVNKEDIRRLLSSLSQVRYIYTLDGQVQRQGEGFVLEIFSDPQQATIVANGTLFLNVHSFDYLEMQQTPEQLTYLDLVQENRHLRLIPINYADQEPDMGHNLDEVALEAMLNQVLSAKWDVQLDDEDYPF